MVCHWSAQAPWNNAHCPVFFETDTPPSEGDGPSPLVFLSLAKGSFQKSLFSRDPGESRVSRDFRESPRLWTIRRIQPFSRDSRDCRDSRDSFNEKTPFLMTRFPVPL